MEKESTTSNDAVEPNDTLEPNITVKENFIPAVTMEQEGRVNTVNTLDPTKSIESIDSFESTITMEPSNIKPNIEMETSEHKDLQYTFIMGHKRAKNPGKLIIGENLSFKTFSNPHNFSQLSQLKLLIYKEYFVSKSLTI